VGATQKIAEVGEGWILPGSLPCAGSLSPFLFPRRFVRFFSFLTHAFSVFFSPAASKLATARTFNVTDVEFWFGAAGDTAVASKSVDGASSLVRAKPQVGVRRERFTQGVWFIQQLCV
jgi:hypothetical protein